MPISIPSLPPAAVLRAYLIGWLPLALVYLIANQTDGDFSRDFRWVDALVGSLRNLGPAFVLLLPVWAYCGWMERRGFGVARTLANPAALGALFAVAWHATTYALIWWAHGRAAAEGARANWFIWQGMWGMMMYWAVAGGFTAYLAVVRARAEAEAGAQAQALLLRSELAALRNKLNPHFLFNTLHSIIALTRRDAARAEAALLIFSDLLRHVLQTEKTGQDQVPLQQELDFTRDYLALEALRLGDRLTVQWDIAPDTLGLAVPALSVQPVVENSIQHAFNPRSAPGILRIATRLDAAGQTLVISVADDGPGCQPGAWLTGQGLGIRTVARRLALRAGPQATPQAGLHIDTRPGAGFRADLILPVSP